MQVRVKPLTKWAKNKVHQHGDTFNVEGAKADQILCRSLNNTFKLKKDVWQTWLGWFIVGVEVEILESR